MLLPKRFNDANLTLGAPANMPETLQLPVFRNDEIMVSLWGINSQKMLKEILLYRQFWFTVWSQTHPPIGFQTEQNIFYNKDTESPESTIESKEVIDAKLREKVKEYLTLTCGNNPALVDNEEVQKMLMNFLDFMTQNFVE